MLLPCRCRTTCYLVTALRAQGCASKLGIVLNLSPVIPATDAPADHAYARLMDGRLVRRYMVRCYYSRKVVSSCGHWDANTGGMPLTDMGWEIYPDGLTELLLRLHRDYKLPLTFITENGAAFKDELSDGCIRDAQRTDFIARHIIAVSNALKKGVRIGGYMVWSLFDNFEWASGYEKRFGIAYVDYATQKRTLKDSALWYREFLKSRNMKACDQEEVLARNN